MRHRRLNAGEARAGSGPVLSTTVADDELEASEPELDDEVEVAAEARRRRGRLLTVAVAVVAVLVAAAGVGWYFLIRDDAPDTQTLTGSFTLTGSSNISRDGASCSGTGGYDDIRGGLGVVVKDAAGKTIATGQLGPGVAMQTLDTGAITLYDCRFPITLTDVPESDFYEIEVGRRGSLSYSQEQMEAAGWNVALTIG